MKNKKITSLNKKALTMQLVMSILLTLIVVTLFFLAIKKGFKIFSP